MHSRWLWRLPHLWGGLVIVALVAAFWTVLHEHNRIHNQERAERLRVQAQLLARWQRERDSEGIQALGRADTLREQGIQVVVTDQGGAEVLNTTGLPVLPMLTSAPEVRQALTSAEGWGTHLRKWGKARRPHVMAAVRSPGSGPGGYGFVWLTCPQWSIAEHPGAALRVLAHSALIVVLLTALLMLFYVRLRRRALRRAVRAVRAMSAGELGVSFELRGAPEFEALSHALQGLRHRLLTHAETLERHRRMLRLLVDVLQEGVVVIGSDNRILLINPAALRLLGLPAEAHREGGFVGQPAENYLNDHQLQRLLRPGDAAALMDTAGATPPAEPAEAGTTRVEIEGEAGTKHLLARVAEIMLAETGAGKTGSQWGRLLTLTDITELQRSIQVRADFVANASHELRTPLSTIRAAIETLLGMDLVAEAPAARTFLEKIDRHSMRLQMMVADLLELSRLETPSQHFAPEPIDVRRLFYDLHLRFAEQLDRKQLQWQAWREPPELRVFEANPYLLRLALDNLVDNAIKFTDPGGSIAVELLASGGELRVVVRDSGCGIPEEEQHRVFERFYQVQRSRSGPDRGTGLGLSIVRHAVAVLRGTVHLKSEYGRGTEITIVLPGQDTSTVLNESRTQKSHKTNIDTLGEMRGPQSRAAYSVDNGDRL